MPLKREKLHWQNLHCIQKLLQDRIACSESLRLPEEERKDFVKRIVKDLRKLQGLKDDGMSAGPTISAGPLFPPTGPQKGQWYFYNANFRAKGLNDFKNKWGNRPNVDNWRRSSAMNGGMIGQQSNPTLPGNGINGANNTQSGGGLSYEELYANLPRHQNY